MSKCGRCKKVIIGSSCICGECLRRSNAAKEDDVRASDYEISELEAQVKRLVRAAKDIDMYFVFLDTVIPPKHMGAREAMRNLRTELAKHKKGG